VPERAWQWQSRIGCGPDRFVPLDWGSELWNWDVSTFESADGIRVAKTRSGRAFDDDDVRAGATLTLLQDVVDAAGGLEAAYKRFGVAGASAQERLDKLVAETGFSKSGPEPELGWNFSMPRWKRRGPPGGDDHLGPHLCRPSETSGAWQEEVSGSGVDPGTFCSPRREAIITARS
jgi:hypothetical protein